MTLRATPAGERLCRRITGELIDQQKHLLEDLDPQVRAGVVQVLQRLASAADARFRSGPDAEVSSCCAPKHVSAARR